MKKLMLSILCVAAMAGCNIPGLPKKDDSNPVPVPAPAPAIGGDAMSLVGAHGVYKGSKEPDPSKMPITCTISGASFSSPGVRWKQHGDRGAGEWKCCIYWLDGSGGLYGGHFDGMPEGHAPSKQLKNIDDRENGGANPILGKAPNRGDVCYLMEWSADHSRRTNLIEIGPWRD